MCWYYDQWPEQFEVIKAQLAGDLADAKLQFTEILHIGSTAVPGLNAKPWLDILVTIPAAIFADSANSRPLYIEALLFGDRQGGYQYIGNGGIRERWSFKLGIREDQDGNLMIPYRCVYIVADDSVHQRSTIALRDTLRNQANEDLKAEYGNLKWALSQRTDFTDIWQYAEAKNKMVRKILKRAGWTDDQVDEKESMREEHWPEYLTI